jgi:hypothetical protein
MGIASYNRLIPLSRFQLAQLFASQKNGSGLPAMTFTTRFATLNTMPIRIGTMTLRAGAKRLQVTSKLN